MCLTQWGTGFYSSLGLAVEFEEGGHVELNVRASRDNINLGTEAYKGWNVAAFLTWMILLSWATSCARRSKTPVGVAGQE